MLEIRGRAQQAEDLFFAQEHRELLLSLRIVNLADLEGAVKHLGIEELQGADGLIDTGAGPLLFRRQVQQVAPDLLGPQPLGRTAVKLNELADGSDIDPAGDLTVAPQPQLLLQPATQLGHRVPPLGNRIPSEGTGKEKKRPEERAEPDNVKTLEGELPRSGFVQGSRVYLKSAPRRVPRHPHRCCGFQID